MTENTLSKSDFQLASTCEQKLLYKKRDYPTAGDSDLNKNFLTKEIVAFRENILKALFQNLIPYASNSISEIWIAGSMNLVGP